MRASHLYSIAQRIVARLTAAIFAVSRRAPTPAPAASVQRSGNGPVLLRPIDGVAPSPGTSALDPLMVPMTAAEKRDAMAAIAEDCERLRNLAWATRHRELALLFERALRESRTIMIGRNGWSDPRRPDGGGAAPHPWR